MVAHYGDKNFFGQFEELRIEFAKDWSGIFGEIDERFEQRGVGFQAHAESPDFIFDFLAAFGGGEDDVVVAEGLFVGFYSDNRSLTVAAQ